VKYSFLISYLCSKIETTNAISVMKKSKLFRFLPLALVFALSACSSDDDSPPVVGFSEEFSRASVQVDQAADAVIHIVESAYIEREESSGTSNSFFPVCTTITTTVTGSNTTILLDFGQGCALPNGILATGTVTLNYGPIANDNRTISYVFDSFSVELSGRSYAVTGNGDLIRMLSNSNGFPQSTLNGAMTFGLPLSLATATVNGLRIVETVEGAGTPSWSDNVYHISGNWNTNFSTGFIRSATVDENLEKRATCALAVAGKMNISQEGFTAVLDYGSGSCDDIVVYIIEGRDYPFSI